MAHVDLGDICDAIADTLATAEGLTRTQSYDELTEGYEDLPLLQVYPQTGGTDVASGTDRTTYRGGVRQSDLTFRADVICRPRAFLAEDMAKTSELIDDVETVLEAQNTRPFFGLAAIKAFRWTWTITTFTQGAEPNLRQYMGARFEIVVRVF